ncbi:unnamed protein product [Brachionus calyciflorus]|uniref:Uncharacterized protein n=1 Tax=Brachionus calyciflorus TaxID=104777 RepID=A0A813P9X6_9BILA|nr:unnamed protein product [Brachionus calyciflorus]
MKFIIFTLATLAIASATVPLTLEERSFWEGLVQALLTPVGTALQTTAELAAQLTAGLAVNGLDGIIALFGKRSADQRVVDLISGLVGDYFTNVIQPALTSASQSLALMAAQLVAGVAEGGLPALQSLLSGLLG